MSSLVLFHPVIELFFGLFILGFIFWIICGWGVSYSAWILSFNSIFSFPCSILSTDTNNTEAKTTKVGSLQGVLIECAAMYDGSVMCLYTIDWNLVIVTCTA